MGGPLIIQGAGSISVYPGESGHIVIRQEESSIEDQTIWVLPSMVEELIRHLRSVKRGLK